MSEYLEIHSPDGVRLVTLAGEQLSIGRDGANDVGLGWDPLVSRRHAVLERYASGWAIRDLGSSNGTYVNSKKILAEKALHTGDEILIGSTNLLYRGEIGASGSATVQAEPAPVLTQRERDVLVSLCRPVLRGDAFPEPASAEQVAEELFVSAAAVRQHLAHLYDKFQIDEGQNRRLRLANEAIRRRAVEIGDL